MTHQDGVVMSDPPPTTTTIVAVEAAMDAAAKAQAEAQKVASDATRKARTIRVGWVVMAGGIAVFAGM